VCGLVQQSARDGHGTTCKVTGLIGRQYRESDFAIEPVAMGWRSGHPTHDVILHGKTPRKKGSQNLDPVGKTTAYLQVKYERGITFHNQSASHLAEICLLR
jgi:hypothetical protein